MGLTGAHSLPSSKLKRELPQTVSCYANSHHSPINSKGHPDSPSHAQILAETILTWLQTSQLHFHLCTLWHRLNATEWSLASVKKHEPSGSIPYPGAACGHLTSCLVFYFPFSSQLSPGLPQGDQIPLPSPEELQCQRTLTPNGTQST